jgi:hypothetical protein
MIYMTSLLLAQKPEEMVRVSSSDAASRIS